jgi:hypothetical protein
MNYPLPSYKDNSYKPTQVGTSLPELGNKVVFSITEIGKPIGPDPMEYDIRVSSKLEWMLVLIVTIGVSVMLCVKEYTDDKDKFNEADKLMKDNEKYIKEIHAAKSNLDSIEIDFAKSR